MLAGTAATSYASTSSNAKLLGIACVSKTNCTAVGDGPSSSYAYTLVEHWDGSTSSPVKSPNPGKPYIGNLSGVSCAGVSDCIAVGYSGTYAKVHALLERWDGSKWALMLAPSVKGPAFLQGVACTRLSHCSAVGYVTRGSADHTLIERLSGSRWSVLTSPNPSGSSSRLNAVACTSDVNCTAVGSQTATGNPTLVEHWDGMHWSVVPSPSRGDIHSELDGVACANRSNCTAVGYYETMTGKYTLIEHWDGVKWSVVPSPNPRPSLTGPSSTLGGIACIGASDCMAVGAGPSGRPLVTHWNGMSWSLVRTPRVFGELASISCRSASWCLAVGWKTTAVAETDTLVERWNGLKWSIAKSAS